MLGFSFAVNVSVMARPTNVCDEMQVNSQGVVPCTECGSNVKFDLYQGGCASYDNGVCNAWCNSGTYQGYDCDCNSSC